MTNVSLRLEMLSHVRAARQALGPAADAVVGFLKSRVGPRGGFRGRGEQDDLYYTVFGLEALLALGAELPGSLPEYIRSCGAGENLDFVHLTCLARCWADVPAAAPTEAVCRRMVERLTSFQAPDGGYAQEPGSKHSTAYGCFLAVGAGEDLGPTADRQDEQDVKQESCSYPANPVRLPGRERLGDVLRQFKTPDGGYANDPNQSNGITPITAGIVVLRRNLGAPKDEAAEDWLRARLAPQGGFVAAPGVPFPDLLSTATALHALRPRPDDPVSASARRFLDTVWDLSAGGFSAGFLDPVVDCEYTWYGLLALGLLHPHDA